MSGLVGQNALKTANKMYKSLEYAKAIESYKEALKTSSNPKDIVPKLADCYAKTSKFKKAAKYYEKSVEMFPKQQQLKFDYAQVLMSLKDYNQAKFMFQQYADKLPNDTRADRYINWCNNVDEYLRDSSEYKVELLPINSKQSDFGPAFYKDGLVFATGRPTGSKDKIDGWTGQTYLDLFMSQSNLSDEWGEAQKLNGWNRSKFHDGPACFTNKSKKMYFTRNTKQKASKDKTSSLSIFSSTWLGDEWSSPKELEMGSKKQKYSAAHPSANEKGDVIYFTSDMYGGYGGKDIYRVKRRNGVWGAPENMGKKINTEGDEMFPFIHEDGTLYFASNGHGGFGGLDVNFSRPMEDGTWGDVQNIGYPINSSRDDFGLILTEDKQTGFIASNRENGKGSDDIYMIHIKANKAQELLDGEKAVSEVKEHTIQSNETTSKIEEVSFNSAEASGLMKSSTFNDRKDFYLIGFVQDYKTKKEQEGQVVELRDLDTNKKKTSESDNLGNLYFHLEEDHRYVVLIRNKFNEVVDFEEVNVKQQETGKIFHIIFEINKPRQLDLISHEDYLQQYNMPGFVPNPNAKKDTYKYKTPKSFADPNPTGDEVPESTILDEGYIPDDLKPAMSERINTENKTTERLTPSDSNTPNNTYTYYDKREETRKVSPPTMNIKYRIQVGSFNRPLTSYDRYLQPIRNEYIEESGPSGFHRYLVGNYSDLDDAEAYKRYMVDLGYKDSYIVIYVNSIRQEVGIDKAPADWLVR